MDFNSPLPPQVAIYVSNHYLNFDQYFYIILFSNISLELPAREKFKVISESEDQIMDDFNSE